MNSTSTEKVRQRLERHGYKCELTGWKLTPDNFCLDHIVPMAQGGDDSIDNLQCVHPLANTAKGTLGQREFIELCIAVADYAKENGYTSTT